MNRSLLPLAIFIVCSSLVRAQSGNEKNLIPVAGSARIDTATSESTATAAVPSTNRSSTSHQVVPPMQATASKNETDDDGFFEFDKRPHLLLLPSLNLDGAGFQPVSLAIGGGFSFEPKYIIAEGLASYHAVRKTNDGTVGNTKGHIRSLNAGLFVRAPKHWFFGADGGWGQLATTNYKKQSRSAAFGGGRDFVISDFPLRIKITYAPSVFDTVNGSQGVNFTLYLPSPLAQKRFTYYEQVGLQFFHATITDPTDPVLTAREKADRSHSASCVFGVRMRF